ncbi:MAG TPA: peptidylprolyl isomerase [Tepidisphaeraceae bacterium]|jgi:cyclophilin family peptidyl-prolyl cis-trans isomerase
MPYPSNPFDSLEPRTLFAAPTLAALPNVTVLAGAPLQIPLDGADVDGDALTFSVTSNNGNVTGRISSANDRSLKISVSHASSGASDPAFTGDMVLKLLEERAPKTTARIIQLAQSGFYNNLTFHRIINNFVIQGGDPRGDGTGGSGVEFDDEFDPGLQFTGSGQLAMAKSADDTDDSQFFITEGPQRHLDFQHTIFGQLVEGESVRDKASNVATDSNTGAPLKPVVMTAVSVIADKQNAVLSLSVPNNVTSGTATITVTARDPGGAQVQRTFTVTIGPDTTNDSPYLTSYPTQLTTQANTPVSFQLTANDVEGDAPTFLDWYGIYVNFVQNHQPGAEQGQVVPPEPTGEPNVPIVLDSSTGAATISPKNNVAGVYPIYVGVAQTLAGFDSQIFPLFVNPAAPTSIDLLDASDTGASTTDNLTRLNNASASSKLQFQVNGVLSGAVVKLFDGATLLGQATVPTGQTSVVITTSGTAALADGLHNLSATQTLANVNWTAGNRSGTANLLSVASAALALTVDATSPTILLAPPFNPLVAPHQLVFRFSEDVSASLSAGDVALLNTTTNTPYESIAPLPMGAAFSYGFPFDVTGGVLPDGNYHATLAAGNVTDRAGNPLAAGATADFFVLAGDANHDRHVDFNDLVALAQNYNTTDGRTFDQGDFNYDGNVDFNDLVILAQRYNTTLPAPVAAPVPAATPVKPEPAKPIFSVISLAKLQGMTKAPARARRS